VIEMGKIKEFVEELFNDYRNNRVTLKQLVIKLCSYADRNICSRRLWVIFEEELNEQFNELGDISY
jgi:hypothetical protein